MVVYILELRLQQFSCLLIMFKIGKPSLTFVIFSCQWYPVYLTLHLVRLLYSHVSGTPYI